MFIITKTLVVQQQEMQESNGIYEISREKIGLKRTWRYEYCISDFF